MLIGNTYPLAGATRAHSDLEVQRTLGKIMLAASGYVPSTTWWRWIHGRRSARGA